MSCGCDWTTDGWGAEFWSQNTVKARKQHKCDECGRTIRPGERYERWSCKFEGSMDWGATCCDCARLEDCHREAMRAVPKTNSYYGETGYIREELRCAIGCMVRESPEYLTAFRAKWKELKAA